jgi:hypothetical protein
MELPESLWNLKSPDGTLLSEFVGGAEPSALPLTDTAAFTNVWQERLADGVARDLPYMKDKAQRVLKFLADHNGCLSLLVWPSRKLTVLFEQRSGDVLLLD